MATKNYGATPSAAADSVTLGDVRVHGFWSTELHVRESIARTTGTMDAPMGVAAPQALTVNRIDARFLTADGSGTTTITIYKNGTTTGNTISIAATGTTGSWTGTPFTLAQNDILTAGITTLGTTPGNGLAIVFQGYI